MKRFTALATAMVIGLAFHANAATPYDLYWIGSSSADAYANFRSRSNWNPARTPGNTDTVFFTNGTVYVNLDRPTDSADSNGSYAYAYHNITNATVYFSTTNAVGELQEWKPRTLNVQDGGKLVMNGVYLSRYSSPDWTIDGDKISFAQGSVNYIKPTGTDDYTADLTGDLTLFVVGNKRVKFSGNNIGFTGKIISMTTELASGGVPRGVVFEKGLESAFPAGTLQIDDGCCSFLSSIQSGEFAMGELTGTGKLGVNSGTDGVELVLNLGGKNTSFTSGVTLVRYTSGSYAASVRKVGTGTLDFQINGCRNLYIDAGKVAMVTTDRIPNSNYPYIKFGGGSLTDSEGKPLVDVSALIKNSTSPISIDIANNATFATQLGNSNVGGLVKRGAGTLTLSKVPAYTGTTVLENGTLVVPQGTTIAELSVVGGKLTVPFTGTEDKTEVLTISSLAAGTTVEALTKAVAAVGATISVESGESGYVVKATRTAQTFVWTGAADTAWENAANWTVGGVVASSAPLAIDLVFVNSQSVIGLSSTASISNLTLNAQTTFYGGQIMNVSEIAGAGLLRMNGVQIRNTTTTTLNFTNNIEVVAGSSNEFAVVTDSKNNSRNIEIYGNITGSGHLTLRSRHTNNFYGVCLHGNNMDFAGEMYVYPYISDGKTERNNTYIDADVASSSNAVWEVYNSSGTHSFVHNGATAYFGALNGKVNQLDSINHKKPTLEIGALPGVTSVLGGTYSRTGADRCSSEGATIRKVGETSVLEFSGVRAKQYQLNAGLFVLSGDPSREFYLPADGIVFGGGTLRVDASNVVEDVVTYVDPSDKIVNSTSAIKVEVGEGVAQTWTNALAVSNVGGLTKLGAGTLTLETAPKYTGWTTVKAGKLVVPAGTALDVVAGAGGEIEGATTNNLAFTEGYTFNTGTDQTIVAAGEADVSNLTVYIANPKGSPVTIVRAGSITGTPTIAFPEGTGEKDKAKWSLRIKNGTLKASAGSPLFVIIR